MQNTLTRTDYVIVDGHLLRETTELIETRDGPVPCVEQNIVLRRETLLSLGISMPRDGRLYLTSHE